ncbi:MULTISPECIES: ankyrin repeat domain-containing protein [unclassified Campylobacter]|uniref:ankyrin repeat domain-containing protein n=1 Tax=unclassified Campylobacter TaxID=2593542 RepID=UPI0022E9C5CA|nr:MULTISPECIES: ankyrin repeat domain-containing protein [unclassified Campylobacter]MDA3062608.1 ankyrin repeat domain-containing protein [Campylobacter sp. JMF_14 EL1]MDA3073864.1 ankyrin repeat domain-containing protein [Campylobacter sp. JMF_10 EL2]
MSAKKPLIVFVLIFVAILALNSDFMGGRKIKTFSVTADTNVSQVKGLSKYVTQEEIDSFAFRHWNIDKDKVMNNDKMENLRLLLKSKNTQEILAYMKDNNISVDEPLHYGVTPLMYSAFYDDIDTAKELLNLGADPHKKDRYKLSPMAYAIGANSINTVKLLFENGIKFEETKIAQSYVDGKWYRSSMYKHILIDENKNILELVLRDDMKNQNYKRAYFGGTIFYVMVENGLIDIAKFALDNGYQPYTYQYTDADAFTTFGNTLEEVFTQEEMKILIETEKTFFKHRTDKEFNLELYLDQERFRTSLYYPLTEVHNYEPMLNLLLDYNISGQPTQKVMREVYEDCYDKYKTAIINKAKYIIDMKTGFDEKKEREILNKYESDYTKKSEKNILIVRTPMEPNPIALNLFDEVINRYGKYCSDKNLDFDKLIYLDDKIINQYEQYRAVWNYEDKKQLDENENFKDVKEFIAYLNQQTMNRVRGGYVFYDTNQTYDEYFDSLIEKLAKTQTERNIFYKNYNHL